MGNSFGAHLDLHIGVKPTTHHVHRRRRAEMVLGENKGDLEKQDFYNKKKIST